MATTRKKKQEVTRTTKKKAVNKPTSEKSQWRILVEEFSGIKSDLQNNKVVRGCEIVTRQVDQLLKSSGLLSEYNIVFLIQDDEYGITSKTSDDIYSAVTSGEKDKKTLLLINSSGGSIEPAYFISKACREYSKSFVVAVPRRAKSAATLISLGADEIHMGSISELGPIDPQIRRLPALALGEAVEYVASIAEKYPKSSDMFAKFMSMELDLQILGHTRRIADSAIDYAERLLKPKSKILPKSPREIGKKLVRGYHDHGFVIDKNEALEILGDKSVMTNTPEYKFSNQIYKLIEDAKLALWVVTRESYDFNFVGSSNGVWFSKKENN